LHSMRFYLAMVAGSCGGAWLAYAAGATFTSKARVSASVS